MEADFHFAVDLSLPTPSHIFVNMAIVPVSELESSFSKAASSALDFGGGNASNIYIYIYIDTHTHTHTHTHTLQFYDGMNSLACRKLPILFVSFQSLFSLFSPFLFFPSLFLSIILSSL